MPQSCRNYVLGVSRDVSVIQNCRSSESEEEKRKHRERMSLSGQASSGGVQIRVSAHPYPMLVVRERAFLLHVLCWCFRFFFPEPWHWGAWNGSTCCNQTCGLRLLQRYCSSLFITRGCSWMQRINFLACGCLLGLQDGWSRVLRLGTETLDTEFLVICCGL